MQLHEAAKDEVDLSMKCYGTFLFALKAVCTALDHPFTNAEYMRIWTVVQAVAAGERTLNESPGGFQAEHPEMLPMMKKHLQEGVQQVMRKERDLASVVVRAADGFRVTPAAHPPGQ